MPPVWSPFFLRCHQFCPAPPTPSPSLPQANGNVGLWHAISKHRTIHEHNRHTTRLMTPAGSADFSRYLHHLWYHVQLGFLVLQLTGFFHGRAASCSRCLYCPVLLANSMVSGCLLIAELDGLDQLSFNTLPELVRTPIWERYL